jgi:hypothetical protein
VFVAGNATGTVSAFDVTRLAFTGPGEVAPGADATFALALTNGDSPIADYTTGSAVVELLDASNAVVATGSPVSPDAAGKVTAVLSTKGLAVGVYSVRVTFTDPAGVVVARAAGFSIAALAATGVNALPVLGVAALLLAAGVALTATQARRRPASGRRISR